MKINNKAKFLYTILLLTISCQPPVIRNFNPDQPKAILTADQSYSRNGFQDFEIHDSLKIVETESLGGLPYFSFLQYSGELIYTTHNGRLYFTNLSDFDDTRKTQMGAGIGTAPTISGSMLYIAVNRGKNGLVAYDMLAGKEKWQLKGELSQSSPIVTNKLVIHASTLGAITAYDTESGERKWRAEIDDRILNNLAFSNNNVIVLTQNGTLRSYNPDSGSLNWSVKLDDAFYASPVIDSTSIFIAGYKGKITKIDLLQGTILNSVQIKTPVYQTPAMDNNYLYVGCGNGQLKAFAIHTMTERWSQQLDGPVTAAPLASASEIILGTASGKLYRVSKTDGQVIQTILLDGRPRSQPVYNNQKIYIAYEPDYLAVLSDRGSK